MTRSGRCCGEAAPRPRPRARCPWGRDSAPGLALVGHRGGARRCGLVGLVPRSVGSERRAGEGAHPPPASEAVLRCPRPSPPEQVPRQPLAPEPRPGLASPRPVPSLCVGHQGVRASRRLPLPRDAVQQIRLGRAHRPVHQLPHPEGPPAPEVRRGVPQWLGYQGYRGVRGYQGCGGAGVWGLPDRLPT